MAGPFARQPQCAVLASTVFGRPIGTVLLGSMQYAINGGAITKPVAIPTIATPAGLAWQGNAAASRVAYATNKRPFVIGTDSEISFIVVFRKQSAALDATTIAGFGASTGAGGNTLFRLNGGATNAPRLQFQLQDGNAGIFYNTESNGTTPINDLNWHTAVVSMGLASGSTLEYTIDGVPNGSVAIAVVTPFATTFNFVTACASIRGGATMSPGGFDVALVAPIFGKLNASEAIELSLNPWQIFASPTRRLFAPPSAAGGFFSRYYYDMGTSNV